ncbi:unnamed protein product [Mytilus coruscus]|uniref:Endonuclease/exonuclease/phosphatase domain-containing protein n=1 Tax=Mytilus coruscus TaxID=42192 RepID=A0A6J8ATX6_MYTCO|nr:unnamed protein product [Mytilus coruscus]
MIGTALAEVFLVYVSEILKTKRRLDLEFENGELIWLEIDFPQHKILLCAVYRSPGSSHPFWQNFKHSIEQAYNYTTKIVITGDLNVDLFTEHNHVLNDLMNIFCLQNVVKEATRFDHRSGRAALLDPILISEDCCATFTEVIDINRQMSDHNATKVYLRIPNFSEKNFTRTIWLYKHADFTRFNTDIQNFDWQTSLTAFEDDVDGMAVFFTEKYIEMAKNSIPTKTVTIQSSDKPWFNSEIRKEIRLRDRLHKKLRKLRTVQNTNKFKVQSNKVNNMIIYAKEQFYLNANGLLDEKSNKNPKAFWSLVKKVMGNCRSTSIPPLLNQY